MRILFLLLLIIFHLVCGCTVQVKSYLAPPALVLDYARFDYTENIQDGGAKINLPINLVRMIVVELIDNGSIEKKHKKKVVDMLMKFFPRGGMLTFLNSKNKAKNFGLAYYKENNDIRIAFLAKKRVVKYFLDSNTNFLKKIVFDFK